MDIVKQDSYEKKTQTVNDTHSNCKRKRNKTRTNTENTNTTKTRIPERQNKNTDYGGITQKKNDCGFCGQQNWTPLHKCPWNAVECNNCHKIGHVARVCRSNTENTKRKRINFKVSKMCFL